MRRAYFTALVSLDHFGLGLYCTRVRHSVTRNTGMKFSLYLGWLELFVLVDLGTAA